MPRRNDIKPVDTAALFPSGAPERDDVVHVLEQYKAMLGTAESLESRRQNLHTFFLSVNSLLLAGIGLIGKEGFDTPAAGFGVIALSAAGVLLSVSWVLQVRAHARLFSSKWEVINALEQELPARPFQAEWRALKDRGYKAFTEIEAIIPWSFIVLYAAALLAGLLLALDRV